MNLWLANLARAWRYLVLHGHWCRHRRMGAWWPCNFGADEVRMCPACNRIEKRIRLTDFPCNKEECTVGTTRDRRFTGPPSVTMWTRPNSSSGVFRPTSRNSTTAQAVWRLVPGWLRRDHRC